MAKHQQRVTNLTITLPNETMQAVYQLVRDGRFASANEVVRAAIDMLLEAKPDDDDGGEDR
ncbi:MAG: ribbon-helix-helix protein, CopG family [Planctomycetes bacterium]|nr:ribbon-helix-helix protein, CopG family [Planctomycetota bacterium]